MDGVRYCSNTFAMFDTNSSEVINTCSLLKPKLSCGIDCISTKLLIGVVDIVCNPLVYVFNLSFKTGCFPSALKIAKVVPIYKGGNQTLLVNYRPISILSAVSKLLERIMYNRMISFSDKNNLISNSQYGFRKGRSTQDAVAKLVNFITAKLDGKLDVSALYVDVSKAFDSIDHDILLRKLCAYGFRGLAGTWFTSYLSARMQYVEYNGVKSSLCALRKGVPQGSVLGPLLFLFYINDLANNSNYEFILFADDTTCLVSPDNLQLACDYVFGWFTRNKLAINVFKTKHMLFTLRMLNPPVITFGNEVVSFVHFIKFLGCTIDDALMWTKHADSVSKSVSKGIAMLRCAYYFPIWIKRMIYFAYVYPHLIDCLAIWGNAAKIHVGKLLTLQKKCVRLIYCMHALDHVATVAKAGNTLMLPELYHLFIALFMFRYVYQNKNFDLFINYGYVPRSIMNVNTRSSAVMSYFVPYVRTNIRKKCVVPESVVYWNNLPNEMRCTSVFTRFKAMLFSRLINSYS
jgi:hypothetical protein